MDKTKLGLKIQALRKARGFSRQDELSAKAGVSVRVVKELEGGKGNTTLNNLASVLGVLKVSFVDVFSDLEPSIVSAPLAHPLKPEPTLAVLQDELKAIRKKLDEKQARSLDPQQQELFDLILGLPQDLIPDAISDIKALIQAASDEDEGSSFSKSK